MRNLKNNYGQSLASLLEKETDIFVLRVERTLGKTDFLKQGISSREELEEFLSILTKTMSIASARIAILLCKVMPTSMGRGLGKKKSKNSTNSNSKSPKTIHLKKRSKNTKKNCDCSPRLVKGIHDL